MIPEEDIQYFWETLQTRQIRVYNGNDKIRWGFSQTETYSLKEAALLLNNISNEPNGGKWGKYGKLTSHQKYPPSYGFYCVGAYWHGTSC